MPLTKATLPREGLFRGQAVPGRAIKRPKAGWSRAKCLLPSALPRERFTGALALLLVLKTPINATNGQVHTRRWHREPRSEDQVTMQKCCVTGQE